jgi:superfamily I DNA and RNA helicase
MKLMDNGVLSNNVLLNPYTSTDFINKGHITLSTVHRAKGNEAPIVFVVGIDAIYGDRKTRSGRNKIFTAFTRTKCCLKVSGIGVKSEYFFFEIDESLNKYPNIEFIQPSKEAVETIQRDLSDKSKKLRGIRKEFYERLKKEGFSDEEINDQMKSFDKV